MRLPNLTDSEYGTDEDLSILDARLINDSPFGTYLYKPLPTEVNPPLFFHILALALFVKDSVATLKILMVIIGLLGIMAFYMLAKRLFNEKIALFSTFLYAINPMHIIYSQHIRSYIFLFFLFALSLYFLHKFLFELDSKSLFYLGLIYFLSVYSHYHTMLFMAGGLATVLLFYWQNKNTKLKDYIILGITIFILAIPSMIFLWQQFSVFSALGGTDVWPKLTPTVAFYPLWKYSVMTDVSTTKENFPYLFALFPLLIGFAVYGSFLLYKQHKEEFIFIITNLSVPYITFTIAGTIWPIY